MLRNNSFTYTIAMGRKRSMSAVGRMGKNFLPIYNGNIIVGGISSFLLAWVWR